MLAESRRNPNESRLSCVIDRYDMDSQAEFDGGICCVARADPLFFDPEERMTCEFVELTDVNFDYIENEELIGHIVEISADVPKVRVCPRPPDTGTISSFTSLHTPLH